ncbi:MAG: sigma-70 family RNA polymerase sigma factor [Planctomycetaceae bacterium]|nr:sigma-70 family RNA polymerase sigma factor [Planctomycetaceae bacterium]
MSASPYDLELIQRCLSRDRQAWESLVDRSLRIVIQVVRHTARSRGIAISGSDQDDLVAEVFLELCKDDFATLRRFRGSSSFSTYLTVIARRVIVRNLVKRPHLTPAELPVPESESETSSLADLNELLQRLNETEASLVRLHHLEGKTYQEISKQIGIPENSIGPTLSRAREKMLTEIHRQEQVAKAASNAASLPRRVA